MRDARRRLVTAEELGPTWKTYQLPVDNQCLRLVAHARRRAEALSIFDPRTSVPPSAYCVLEVIAKTGPNGITQAELAKRLGLAPKDMFHQVKSLTKLGLISRSSVVGHHDKPIATIRLCLKKYANVITDEWQLDPEKPAPIEEEDDDDETNPAQGETVKRRLVSYSTMAWLVCERLAQSGDMKAMRPYDLKEYLREATAFKRGCYRTVRDKLLSLGYIESVNIVVAGTNQKIKCVRLIKKPKSVDELNNALTTIFMPAKVDNQIPLLIEYPLEYQLILMVAHNERGLLQSDLKFPGVLSKAVANRIKNLKDRQSINTKIENQGKMRTAVITLAFKPSHRLPLVPRSGASVTRSFAPNMDVDEEKRPLVPSKPISAATQTRAAPISTDPSIVFSPTPKTTKVREATEERKRRLNFIRGILDTEGYAMKPELLVRIREAFPPLSGDPHSKGIDLKTLSGLINELESNGEAQNYQTTIEGKKVKVIAPANTDPNEVVQKIYNAGALARPTGTTFTNHFRDAATIEVSADQLHSSLSNQRYRTQDRRTRAQWDTGEASDDDEVVESDEEDEEVDYMDTDDEEEETQRRAAVIRRRREARVERLATPLESVAMGHVRRQRALLNGYERLKVERAHNLHVWLCQHRFFNVPASVQELPNDIEETVERNKEAQHAEAVAQNAVENADGNPTGGSRFLSQLGRLGSRPREQASEIVSTENSAPAAEHEALTKKDVETLWFTGTSFNIEALLPEIPLYLYMKIVGIAHEVPGLPEPHKASDVLLKNLPAAAREYLLNRRYYEHQLTPVVDLLKRLSLLRAPATALTDSNSEAISLSGAAPVLKLVILNPVAIIQYRLAVNPTKSVLRKERLYTFRFDRETPEGKPSEAAMYWKYLQRSLNEYTDSIKEVEDAGFDYQETLDPYVPGAFPARPNQLGIPIEKLWRDAATKERMPVSRTLWEIIRDELKASNQSHTADVLVPTPSMIALAEKHNRDVSIIARRCLKWWKDHAPAKPKVDEHDDVIPAPAKSKGANAKKRRESTTFKFGEAEDEDVAPKTKKRKENLETPKKSHSSKAEAQGYATVDEGDEEEESEDESTFVTRANRLGQRQKAAFLDHYIDMKARNHYHLDDMSELYEGIDKRELALKANRPWERLEMYLREYSKDVASFKDLAARIASRRRELSDEEEDIEQPVKPIIFTLPSSIEEFRAQNMVIYSNSHQLAQFGALNAQEPADPEEEDTDLDAWLGFGADSFLTEKVNNTYLHFSYSTKRLCTQILPLSESHAVRALEERIYSPDFGAGLREPASTWMIPNPVDPIVSDAIKTVLGFDVMSQGQSVLAPINPATLDICFEALRIRRIMLAAKLGLTYHWTFWKKQAANQVQLSTEARTARNTLLSEETGTAAVREAIESGEARSWSFALQGVLHPGMAAALVHGAHEQELVMGTEVGSLNPVTRRSRRELAVPTEQIKNRTNQAKARAAKATASAGLAASASVLKPVAGELLMPKNKSAESEILSTTVTWWREADMFNRYLEPSFPVYQGEVEEAPQGNAETHSQHAKKIILPITSSPIATDSDLGDEQPPINEAQWNFFVQLQQALYDDTEEWIDFCRSILDLVVASEKNAIELTPLASALFAKGYLLPTKYTGVPSLASVETLKEALADLAGCGLVLRVLGEFEEAWVVPSFSEKWTITAKHKHDEEGEGAESDRVLEKVPFQPWTNHDGSLNTTFLNLLRAHLTQIVLSAPGITEEAILDKFLLFRPAICREILRLLETDKVVQCQFRSYRPMVSMFPGHYSDEEFTDSANDSDYHDYLWLKAEHIRNGSSCPDVTVAKSFWPAPNAHFLL